MGKLDGLKPFYVYELRDERDNTVFYVGKGQDDRLFQHAKEANRGADDTEKLRRIVEIKKSGFQVKEIVIGRYNTEKEAHAVESTLIHWVYGLDALTNITSGHGVDFIRPKGCYDTLQGIDEPALGYSERNEENRSRNNIIPYLEEIRELIESRCDFKFDGYHTHNPRHTYLYKLYKGVMLTVVCHHRAKHAASVTIEAIDGTKASKAQVRYVCDNSRLEWKDKGRYGRIMPAGTYSDPDVIFEKFIETLTELDKVSDERNDGYDVKTTKNIVNKPDEITPSNIPAQDWDWKKITPNEGRDIRDEETTKNIASHPEEISPFKEPDQKKGWGKKTPWGHSTIKISGMIDYYLYHNEKGITLYEVAMKCGCPESRVKDHINNDLRVGARSNGKKAIISEQMNSDRKRCYRLHDGFSND